MNRAAPPHAGYRDQPQRHRAHPHSRSKPPQHHRFRFDGGSTQSPEDVEARIPRDKPFKKEYGTDPASRRRLGETEAWQPDEAEASPPALQSSPPLVLPEPAGALPASRLMRGLARSSLCERDVAVLPGCCTLKEVSPLAASAQRAELRRSRSTVRLRAPATGAAAGSEVACAVRLRPHAWPPTVASL
eukprot:scaffold16098_cov101-Isochrysis_galbana.AAC.2